MPAFIDLTNQRFGRFTVISQAETVRERTRWKCRCDCGNMREVIGATLRRGASKSCGCFQKDHPSRFTHGESRKSRKEYQAWFHMIRRCFDPKDAAYKHYGARGISVCDAWVLSFPLFLADMGKCPPRKSLGRIKNDLGYSKENCRWEDCHQQQRNKRNNHLLTFNGRTKTLAEWSVIRGLGATTIRERLNRGWPVDRAILEPIQ